jgi:tetratricopeptide (TPR) repeat protein
MIFKQHAAQEVSELEKKLLIFYAALANHCGKELISNAELAILMLQVEEANLLQYLRLAEQQHDWAEAQSILQALGEVYERIGSRAEFRVLRQRALGQIGIYQSEAKAKGRDAFNFWMYLRGMDTKDALAVANWEGAKAIYKEILDELKTISDASVNEKIAGLYHNLGYLAQEQRHFDEAVAYYQKALQIREDVGDFYNAATDYLELGVMAQKQRYFDEAVAYYQKSLKIFKGAGDLHSAASAYHNLGVVAQEQRHFDKALTYYQKALQIYENTGAFYENTGAFYDAAREYHHLGMVAQEQKHFDEAVTYYKKALQIYKNARDLYSVADEYHQLGMLAQHQRRFDDAIAFYQKAFEIRQQFQDWRKVSSTLSQWGNLLEIQEKWAEALQICIHAFAIDLEHNEEWIGWDIRNLGRMLKTVGERKFEAVWREVTGEDCPEELRSEIQVASEENEE